jgi:pimeloyl-ACP methyl ester carboxylesterase
MTTKNDNQNSTSVRSSKQKILLTTFKAISKIHPKLGSRFALNAFFTPTIKKQRLERLPAGTKTHHKVFQGKKIKMYRYGRSVKKILLIHGWNGAASDFYAFYKPLQNAGYEIISFDLPGHGFSSRSQLNAIICAKIINDIKKRYGPLSAIIGHSFGAFSSGYAFTQYQDLQSTPFVSIGSPNKLKNVIGSFSRTVGLTDQQNRYFESLLEEKLKIQIHRIEHGRFLKNHFAPKLVVHDEQDKMVPISVIDEMKKYHSNSTYHITQKLGHNRILRDEKTIGEIIKFVENNQPNNTGLDQHIKFGIG